MQKLKIALYSAGASVLGVLGFASTAHMAADTDVVSTTAYVATSIKDNVFAVINGNIATVLSIGVLVLMIMFIWKFAKRFMGGK